MLLVNLYCMCMFNFSHTEPTSPTPEVQSIFAQETFNLLPSTERSESILHLKRSKSENSLTAQTRTSSLASPWIEPLHSSSPVPLYREVSHAWEQSAVHVDNTLSMNTDFVEDENPDAEGDLSITASPADKLAVGALMPHNIEEGMTASPLSFVNVSKAVVAAIGGLNGQECISSYSVPSRPMKTTIIHTTIHMNGVIANEMFEESDSQASLKEDGKSQSFVGFEEEPEISENGESNELDPVVPLPRERKNTVYQVAEVEYGSGKIARLMPSPFIYGLLASY